MFKFEHKSHDNTKVTLETEAVCLTDILEEFEMFLKGCGFSFDGNIVIEDPEEFEIDQDRVDLVQELSHKEDS